MDLEYFRNFIMIVDSHTLTEAARRLNVVQPALSAQLKHIESHFNADLIKTQRGGRRIILTEAGQLLYNQAKYMLTIADSLERDIADRAAGSAGLLRLSVMPAMVPSFISEYVEPFHKAFPNIEFSFFEGNADEQAEALMAGVTEIGFLQTPLSKSYMFHILQAKKRGIEAVVKKDNPWLAESLQYVRLKDLEDLPLCVTRRLDPLLDRAGENGQIHLVKKAVCATRALAMAWAENCLGISIVTAGGENTHVDPSLSVIPIRERGIVTTEVIYMVKERPLSNVARTFLSFFNLEGKAEEGMVKKSRTRRGKTKKEETGQE